VDPGRGFFSRPTVYFQDFSDFRRAPIAMFMHRPGNYTMNFAKSYPTIQESRDRHFIGRVKHSWHGATLA
jgi:hypothetical protein